MREKGTGLASEDHLELRVLLLQTYLNIYICYVMLCYVMLCYAMLCYVMLCYAMLCMYVCMYVCMNVIDMYKCIHNMNVDLG